MRQQYPHLFRSASVSSPFTLNFFLTINASLETNFFLLSRNARSFSKTWKTRSLICSLLYPLLRMIHYLLMKSLRLYKRRPRSPRYVCFGMLHVLESEAQDTEDRVEAVNLKVEKV
ncbi:hypothetical protein ERO13_A10G203901v2 [Gossypium hirsutum]|nr:hypothetical protein ERO13_A10G203901v2 [Gossypium hirsutum]